MLLWLTTAISRSGFWDVRVAKLAVGIQGALITRWESGT